MATYRVTAEMNLQTLVAQSREVAQALNEFADNLERIERKYAGQVRGTEGQNEKHNDI